ncbi:hypothetical protein B0T17DRAFT_588850 [Bombardia bombarda]|uniref:Uncharacterized protein n=1 Tax=Bombardia bombarda TaxID=252184 RepID=A0AA40C890_9PEZI|nr:hypothetical protein B0T17DRAFT_588850 [Bombardia bombarda]
MARDNDAAGTSQSKRPALNHFDSSSSQITIQAAQQHRTKSSKHLVGGGSRLHARVPSSKGLHKHHASTSSAKLNRRQGSPSPDRGTGPPLATTHRRATSTDLKLASPTQLKDSTSQTSLKRNRSHVDVAKKNKSSTNLKRSSSNPAVHKLKSPAASTKVHFNLGDDGQDDTPDDEWVDASTSASPLLSRRGSAVAGGQATTPSTLNKNDSQASSPALSSSSHSPPHQANEDGGSHSISRSLSSSRDVTDHNQYLTSRILQRIPSHGAAPKMSTENVSVRPPSTRQHSPDSADSRNASSTLSGGGTPRLMNLARPGSSGKEELTSRFVGTNSQEDGSGIPGYSLLGAAVQGGLSRVTKGGRRAEGGGVLRPRSLGDLEHAKREKDRYDAVAAATRGRRHGSLLDDSSLTDEEDVNTSGVRPGVRGRRRGGGGGGTYGAATARDMNRTQQKLNLQRASSSLESAHPHPGIGIGLAAVAAAAGPLVGGSNYDSSHDPRLGKLLERTGIEYLVVRRYQNPVGRSLSRLMQLPGVDKHRQVPQPLPSRPGTAHSRTDSDLGGERPPTSSTRSLHRESREPTTAAVAVPTLMNAAAARRPPTPRRAYSSIAVDDGAGSGLEHDVVADMARMNSQRLSGTSLVDGGDVSGSSQGEEDVEMTIALLRNLWDKNMDLSASQE